MNVFPRVIGTSFAAFLLSGSIFSGSILEQLPAAFALEGEGEGDRAEEVGEDEDASAEEVAWETLDERPGQGEQCLVCGFPIYGKNIVEIRYQGRTFYVAKPLLKRFARDPDKYFHKLQARSVLFDEGALKTTPLAMGWLIAGLYVLAGLVFAAVCGYVAVHRALSPIPWFFAGLAGNVAGLVLVFLAPKGDASRLPAGIPAGLAKVPMTRSPAACRACGTPNHPSATVCSGCRGELTPTVDSETRLVRRG